MIDKIREVLSRNPNLNQETKEVIEVSLDLFFNSTIMSSKSDFKFDLEKLSSLNIEEVSNYVLSGLPARYINVENKLKLNSSVVLSSHQGQVFLQQLINIITYKDSVNNSKTEEYQAFFDGYSSLLSKNVISSYGVSVDNNHNYYFDEEVMVNLLGTIVGEDVIEDSCLNRNIDLIVNALKVKGISDIDIKNTFSLMNHNQRTRHTLSSSNLVELQKKTIDMVSKMNGFERNQLDKFKANLINNSEYVPSKDREKYIDISAIDIYYNNVLGRIMENDLSQELETEGMVR